MALNVQALILLTCFASQGSGFWWYFTKRNGAEDPSDATQLENTLERAFAPFEVTPEEEKFLMEASDYLGKLPKLDRCHVLVINRLKQSCSKMSEEELAKLSVNLLNCQSVAEGRKVYKCTDTMTLTECTSEMDSDTWNAYHIVSNRARAVCYNFRQAQFRMKTEITVNKLADSALNNLDTLQKLLNGQDKLSEVTQATTQLIQEGQKNMMDNNKRLESEHLALKDSVTNNIKLLSIEKVLMDARKKQMENFSGLVNKQFESLLKEFQRQGSLKKKGDKEIVSNLEAVKGKSQEVLQKLESTLENMDSKYATIEQKHSETMKSMEDIQKTIGFMNHIMKKLEVNIDRQITWLNYFVGGTEDKLTVITTLLSHALYFFVAVLTVLFVGGSILTKIVVVALFPMNALMAVRGAKHFKIEELSMIVLLTYPAFWLFRSIVKLCLKLRGGNGEETLIPTPLHLREQVTFPVNPVKQEPDMDNEITGQCPQLSADRFDDTNALSEDKRLHPLICPHFATANESIHSAPSTPKGRRRLLLSSTPTKGYSDEGSQSLPSTPTSEGKHRSKCLGKTLRGLSCRKSATMGDFCKIHASKCPLLCLNVDDH